jgi:16S rRNA (uracil1498-N3)-methyltransferase
VSGNPWFIAPPGDWRGDHVLLDLEETHHALHVLRLSPSETITVFDGTGTIAEGSLGGVNEDRLAVRFTDKVTVSRPQPEIVLYQAAPKGTKVDAIVERSAELGVAELCVFESHRSVVRWEGDKPARLAARWNAVARAAAKQSRQAFVMQTGPPVTWTEALERIGAEKFAVTLWEDASGGLRAALPPRAERIAIVVGPEGGFAIEEVQALAEAGASPVSLGPHIFRTEMAPLVAACTLLWHYGGIG